MPQRQGERVCEGRQWPARDSHHGTQASPPLARPRNGSIILYNRKKVKYRKDGYLWKKRRDGKTTREDHMKLKVQGMEVRRACSGGWAALLRPQPGSGPPPPTLRATPPFSLPWFSPGGASAMCHLLGPASFPGLGHPRGPSRPVSLRGSSAEPRSTGVSPTRSLLQCVLALLSDLATVPPTCPVGPPCKALAPLFLPLNPS